MMNEPIAPQDDVCRLPGSDLFTGHRFRITKGVGAECCIIARRTTIRIVLYCEALSDSGVYH